VTVTVTSGTASEYQMEMSDIWAISIVSACFCPFAGFTYSIVLPVEYRIVFKIAAITYKVLTTGQPNYLRDVHPTAPYVQQISSL